MLDILPKDLMNIVLDYYLPDYRKMYDDVVYDVDSSFMRIISLNKTFGNYHRYWEPEDILDYNY